MLRRMNLAQITEVGGKNQVTDSKGWPVSDGSGFKDFFALK